MWDIIHVSVCAGVQEGSDNGIFARTDVGQPVSTPEAIQPLSFKCRCLCIYPYTVWYPLGYTVTRRASEVVLVAGGGNMGTSSMFKCYEHVRPWVFLVAQQMLILNVVQLLVRYLRITRYTISPIPMSKSFLRTWDEDNRVVVILWSSCVSLDTMETTRGSADSALTPAINRLFLDSASFGTNSLVEKTDYSVIGKLLEKKFYALYWKEVLCVILKSAIWESSLLQDISWITY